MRCGARARLARLRAPSIAVATERDGPEPSVGARRRWIQRAWGRSGTDCRGKSRIQHIISACALLVFGVNVQAGRKRDVGRSHDHPLKSNEWLEDCFPEEEIEKSFSKNRISHTSILSVCHVLLKWQSKA